MTDSAPAGWHPDPDDPSQWRYWDGTQWTDHRAPRAAGGGPLSFPTPVEAKSPKSPEQRRKVLILVGAVAVCLVMLTLVGIYQSQSSALAEYKERAGMERSNRAAIAKQYEQRAGRFDRIRALEDQIDTLHDEMTTSDCFTTTSGSCNGAATWNSNGEKLGSLFEERSTLAAQSTTAVNKIKKVSPPEDLWMLTMLGKNDAPKIQAGLDSYLTRIGTLKRDINESIKASSAWDDGCKADAIIQCSSRRYKFETEK